METNTAIPSSIFFLWRHLILHLKGGCQEDGARLCLVVPSKRTRGTGHRKFQLCIRKNFFTLQVPKHWNRLPTEGVECLSLEIFKNLLDTSLCNGALGWPCLSREIGWDDSLWPLATSPILWFSDLVSSRWGTRELIFKFFRWQVACSWGVLSSLIVCENIHC